MSQATTWDLVADAYQQEVAPIFRVFALEMLRRVPVGPGKHALDVAAGPGTVSLLAAAQGARVDAIDFAPEMIAQLRARLVAHPELAVEPRVGDGMALPYPDASFDAGYSQFGLMFFPDRAQGFRELARVLRSGARAAITSWAPLSKNEVLVTCLTFAGELAAAAGLPTPPPVPPPLSDPTSCHDEMSAGGFREVEVHQVSADAVYEDAARMIASFFRSSAPFVVMKQKLGARAAEFEAALSRRASGHYGSGPVQMNMPAYLTLGVR